MNKILYIAYGSNMNAEQMQRRCPDAEIVGKTMLRDYRLLFRGGFGSAVATIEPEADCAVPVLLWEISDRDHMALDRYEGWPRLYRKELLLVTVGRRKRPAMVYIMNSHTYGTPSRGYLDIIREGYLEAGFDLNVLYDAVSYSS